MHLHAVLHDVKCNVRHVQEVIREILLDDVALVSEANHEFVDSIVRVNLHDVPQYWPATNFDHRLRLEMGFLAYASAESSSENDCFHRQIVAAARGTKRFVPRL